MRIGDLARETGVSAPTIKYYTREGLLPVGERTSPNQVRYDDAHVRRLRLIRAMLEVGGMSIAAARQALTEIDDPDASVHTKMGVAQHAVSPPPERGGNADWEAAEREVDDLIQRHDWHLEPGAEGQINPGRHMLVQIVATYRALGQDLLLTLLEPYAEAANRLAQAELEVVTRLPTTDGKVEGALLGTVLGDAAMSALRRIAQEDVSQRVQAGRQSA